MLRIWKPYHNEMGSKNLQLAMARRKPDSYWKKIPKFTFVPSCCPRSEYVLPHSHGAQLSRPWVVLGRVADVWKRCCLFWSCCSSCCGWKICQHFFFEKKRGICWSVRRGFDWSYLLFNGGGGGEERGRIIHMLHDGARRVVISLVGSSRHC